MLDGDVNDIKVLCVHQAVRVLRVFVTRWRKRVIYLLQILSTQVMACLIASPWGGGFSARREIYSSYSKFLVFLPRSESRE